MNLIGVANTVQRTMLASPLFPYKTGQLHDNFIDKGSEVAVGNTLTFTVLSNPLVNYGRILEVAPAIRYKIRKLNKKGNYYTYTKHKNRHFRYIERIIESYVISAIENEHGVRYVSE